MDGGASQFTGGGFIASQDGAATGTPGGVKRFSSGQQTLRAVTVKQLFEATSQAIDDQYVVDGEELNNVTIVGRIVSSGEAATCLSFKIDDGTGVVDVRYWIDREDSPLLQESKAQWHQNAYVRIHGNVRSFNNERQVVAFNIRAITDFNEVTYHFLQVIFQHEHISRGAHAANLPGSDIKSKMGAVPEALGGGLPPAKADDIGNDGLNTAQRLCKEVLESPECCNSDVGFTIQEVASRLTGRATFQQVKDAVDFLYQECHIYTTTDDDHFKSTMA